MLTACAKWDFLQKKIWADMVLPQLLRENPAENVIGLRADFDALSLQEDTGLSFASQNPGVCHACVKINKKA